jgi:hypothetical protein
VISITINTDNRIPLNFIQKIAKSSKFILMAPHVSDALSIRDMVKKETNVRTDKSAYVSDIETLIDAEDIFITEYDFLCPELYGGLINWIKEFDGNIHIVVASDQWIKENTPLKKMLASVDLYTVQ